MTHSTRSTSLTYLGIFLVALSTLMLEVLLTRITSVSSWYHLAFFVISLGMLGMTLGAVLVFLRGDLFDDARVALRLAQSTLGFALATPISVAMALSMPLAITTDFMGFIGLLTIGCVLALPFVLGGVTLTLALTRAGLPPSTAYGVDLIGAACGCGLVIPVLGVVDAPSAALLAAALAALAAFAFARAAGTSARGALTSVLVLLALCAWNASAEQPALRPAWVKGVWDDPSKLMYVGWNSYSRVSVANEYMGEGQLWGPGANTPVDVRTPRKLRMMAIDGAAGTTMTEMGISPVLHTYLDWDVASAVHALRPSGAAAVIGVGGGRDIITAVRVGHKPVVGIELNQLIVDLHKGRMKDFSRIATLDGVTLVCDEARSYLARDKRRYNAITMSLIDTWAATGTGAYSLSENGLYTTEAWQTFLSRLEPRGVLSVSRWYYPPWPGETTRMVALAMDAAWAMGAKNPRDHIILLQAHLAATLLLSPSPFSDADLERVKQLAIERGFNILLSPRKLPKHQALLRQLASQKSRNALYQWSEGTMFDFSPPTDARPFFFNMLRPNAWLHDRQMVDEFDLTFLGNLQASRSLIYATMASLLLTLLAIGVPMARRTRELRALPFADVAAALCYFALIGLGFMLVEMGLLSRLSVFLGHPTLALAVLLGGIIFFTGIGSLASGKIDLDRPALARSYPLLPCALALGAAASLEPLMQAFRASDTPVRVLVSLLLVAVPALGLGLGFPVGLRLAERMEERRAPAGSRPRLGPWLWGVNGAFGVCASGLGLGISMTMGIPVTLLAGAVCYLLLLFATNRLSRA